MLRVVTPFHAAQHRAIVRPLSGKGAEHMPRVVTPLPQFAALTEAQVMAAMNDPHPGDPIAVEVARLMAGYGENFGTNVKRSLNRIPDSYLPTTDSFPPVKLHTPIEVVAMRLTTQTLQQQLQTYGDHRQKAYALECLRLQMASSLQDET